MNLKLLHGGRILHGIPSLVRASVARSRKPPVVKCALATDPQWATWTDLKERREGGWMPESKKRGSFRCRLLAWSVLPLPVSSYCAAQVVPQVAN